LLIRYAKKNTVQVERGKREKNELVQSSETDRRDEVCALLSRLVAISLSFSFIVALSTLLSDLKFILVIEFSELQDDLKHLILKSLLTGWFY
jgi:hypothetical protein